MSSFHSRIMPYGPCEPRVLGCLTLPTFKSLPPPKPPPLQYGQGSSAGVDHMDFIMGEVRVQRVSITHLNDIKLKLGFGKLGWGEDGKEERL